jgi:MPBQ/MSBQ methyltransferase
MMTDLANLVEQHYGRGKILDRLLAALAQAGVNPDKFNYADLWPYDQLHTRGIAATREHARRANIRSKMRLLDLGCGIGGSSRYLAGELGCRVSGIDLTHEYIAVARELTRRCGLADRIEYRVGNALALPFDAGSFEHVYSHNVTMNIQDKAGLAREVARVLRSGGTFSCSELGRGPAGEVTYPLPWASDPSASFLARPEEMRRALEAGGLRVDAQFDLTDANRAASKEASERNKRGEPPLQRNDVVMGDDFPARVRNSTRNVLDGALVEFLFIAQKP